MKVAITAQEPDLDAQMDPRFGRAAFILIVDTDSGTFEAINNAENAGLYKGAGIQAATVIADRKAAVLLTGFCGPKAFQVLDAAGVKVVTNLNGKIRNALYLFETGTLTYSSLANAEAYW